MMQVEAGSFRTVAWRLDGRGKSLDECQQGSDI
jgi:hypothetical protein